ncbi:HflK protein [Myxococcus stipitatus DSM 14675]|uniref:Protein HflK n=1 Tax=Myxococcus stipitatus (strain DSM 14675 / JCM 12634 / Mx s8) TaxID=1278073 RepID=L7UHT9_MYXSD|nr:FtsH protease activity modulator HflK [Myxococcus stipitatus]AGC47132.1 HflK protein [Myxococcus stipitatus DSM 14675]
MIDESLIAKNDAQPPEASVLAINILVVVLILGGMAAQNLFYTAQPEERVVIKRFGAVIGLAGPGLHFKLPFGIDEVHKVATERVLKQEFGFRIEPGEEGEPSRVLTEGYQHEREMLTGDLNMIDVSWVVQYQIHDPVQYLHALREPEQTLRDSAEAVMRRRVGNSLASEVLTTGRADIALRARDELQGALDGYRSGIRVTAVELQAVVPPQRVRASFNEVNEARQERERMINEAITKKNQAIPQAIGEGKRTVAEAEAYAFERTRRAEGDVVRFQSILKEYLQAPDVTRKRLYLEVIRDVVPKAGKIIVVQEGESRPQSFLHLNEQGGSPK